MLSGNSLTLKFYYFNKIQNVLGKESLDGVGDLTGTIVP